MELYNRNHEEGKCEHAPIRGSIFILVEKLLVIVLLFELLYGAAFYIFTLGIPLPFDLHHHIAESLFILEIVKIVIQVTLIVNVTLSWTNNVYFINGEGKHLIKRTGIIKVKEDVYQFDTVRSITINQSWLGRIFHYGDVTLKTSASGGYQAILTITGIQNPQDYAHTIRECL